MKKNIVVLGAGNIGFAAAFLLHHSNNYNVVVIDKEKNTFSNELQKNNISIKFGDLKDNNFLKSIIIGNDYVLSACPFFLNKEIANVCNELNVNYFDFTEDIASTEYIKNIAIKNNKISFMPQCGLAPGYISIAANYLSKFFDELDTVTLRVGALTQSPNNLLKYNLSWSTDGLINEYVNPCIAIANGEFKYENPLEGLERLILNGIEYEAFNTSGGIGGLVDILKGKVKNLNYKTIRYLGHRDLMYFLLNDLKFKNNQKDLVNLFNKCIPSTIEDVVLIYISCIGYVNGKLFQKTVTKKINHQEYKNHHFTAIQLTTAGSACAAIDMHSNGYLSKTGFISQEQIDFKKFSENQFTTFYKNI